MEKNKARYLGNLAVLELQNRPEADMKITSKLLKLVDKMKPKSVFIYLSNNVEVDTFEIFEELQNRGIEIAIPYVVGRKMIASKFSGEELIENKFRILEQRTPCDEIYPDLTICPLRSFDKTCNRVGYGFGYYDRFLKKYNNTIAIGLAYDSQKVEKIDVDNNDVELDKIITEVRIYENNSRKI